MDILYPAKLIEQAYKIREKIALALPPGSVVPEHTETGHFYRVPSGRVFPSVTGKLQILKDEGLANWKMNQAINYIFAHYKEFTDQNILDHLEAARQLPAEIFQDAGSIGTAIHNAREDYFQKWIDLQVRPDEQQWLYNLKMTPDLDPRVISGMRALMKFCNETMYWPVACELMVYDEELEVAGQLDDIGIIPDKTYTGRTNATLVLLDVKTSNAFKDHYHYQVILYYYMFRKLTGIRPQKCLILKLDKDDGTYKTEYMSDLPQLVKEAKLVLKINNSQHRIKESRKSKAIYI